jgi:hypothetical protein
MFNVTKRSRLAVPAGIALSLALVVGAFAYWTLAGAGSGTAATGDIAAVTVNQLSEPADLYPGGPAQDLFGDFDNPNAGDVMIGEVTVVVDPDWTSSDVDASKPACTAADFEIGGSAVVEDEIPSGDGVGEWSGLTIALLNLSTNQDNCKNAVAPLIYEVVPTN